MTISSIGSGDLLYALEDKGIDCAIIAHRLRPLGAPRTHTGVLGRIIAAAMTNPLTMRVVIWTPVQLLMDCTRSLMESKLWHRWEESNRPC